MSPSLPGGSLKKYTNRGYVSWFFSNITSRKFLNQWNVNTLLYQLLNNILSGKYWFIKSFWLTFLVASFERSSSHPWVTTASILECLLMSFFRWLVVKQFWYLHLLDTNPLLPTPIPKKGQFQNPFQKSIFSFSSSIFKGGSMISGNTATSSDQDLLSVPNS